VSLILTASLLEQYEKKLTKELAKGSFTPNAVQHHNAVNCKQCVKTLSLLCLENGTETMVILVPKVQMTVLLTLTMSGLG